MRDDLELKLQTDFSFMAQNRVDEERNTYRRWGCECGDGWYGLLHELCESITKIYESYEMPIDIVVLQVKQKFAALRFYYEFDDTPCPIQAFDFIDNGTSPRLTPDNSVDEKKQKLRKDIADLVRNYEKKSASICEICGMGGELRKVTPYYVRTLCENCYNDLIQKKMEKKKSRDINGYLD